MSLLASVLNKYIYLKSLNLTSQIYKLNIRYGLIHRT